MICFICFLYQVVKIKEFDCLKTVKYCYLCKCNNYITINDIEKDLVKCDSCNGTFRKSNLERKTLVIVQASVIDENLYKIDANELCKFFPECVIDDLDQIEITEKFMRLQNFEVQVDRKGFTITLLNKQD